ncbi:MAG: lysine--tRNA ligase [Planctomycetota bacterium]
MSLIEYEDFRLDSLKELQERDVDPFGERFPDATPSGDLLEMFEEDEDKDVRTAGRITNIREMGKATFMDIKDGSGSIQIFFQQKRLGEEEFETHKHFQPGDFVGVEGELTSTRTGEITVFVADFTFLTKALLRPPEKWHGLQDPELRYRRRYLDLFANDEVMECFRQRSRIISEVRAFLEQRRFFEVETPMMQSVPGGAAARPFVTHHNALDIDLYLRVAPELYLKRLLVGGMNRVFEINRNFRNEGIDRQHNPEFTSLEVYQAYADYTDMMELTESLIRSVARSMDESARLPFGDHTINYADPFRKVNYFEAFEDANGFSPENTQKLTERAAELDIDTEGLGRELLLDRVFEHTVEDEIIQPTFIMDYPAALSPLTRPREDDPEVAQRWDLIIGGMEIGPAYTELNDPRLQEEKFLQQLEGEDEAEETFRSMDTDFVRALAHGMPPAGGMGMGIDRLVMLMTDNPAIREVILFPLLRPVED